MQISCAYSFSSFYEVAGPETRMKSRGTYKNRGQMCLLGENVSLRNPCSTTSGPMGNCSTALEKKSCFALAMVRLSGVDHLLNALHAARPAKPDSGRIFLWLFRFIRFRLRRSPVRDEGGKLLEISGCCGFFLHAGRIAFGIRRWSS